MNAVRTRALLALAALLALPMAVQAQADTRPIVAVLYFDNNSIGKDAADFNGLGKGVADLLINELAANANLRVVERDRVEALLKEQDLTRAGAIDPQTAVRLGKLLGAHHMITGGFMSTGRQMVLTSRTIDVETGAITNPQRVQQSGDDVLALVGQLSSRVSAQRLPATELRTGDAGAAPAPGHAAGHHPAGHAQAPAPVQAGSVAVTVAEHKSNKGTKLDLRSALLYSKALEAQDAGDRTRAVELYNQVLDKFPSFESARQSRDRLAATGN